MSDGMIGTEFRVRYNETDRMRVVHHTNYLVWFEIGRTEYLRAHGATYRELEEDQLYMPVIEAYCRFRRPARYDEVVRVETSCARLKQIRLRFSYRVLRATDNVLLAEGWTAHGPTDAEGAPRRIPPEVLRMILPLEESRSE